MSKPCAVDVSTEFKRGLYARVASSNTPHSGDQRDATSLNIYAHIIGPYTFTTPNSNPLTPSQHVILDY